MVSVESIGAGITSGDVLIATDHARGKANRVCRVVGTAESRTGEIELKVRWWFRQDEDDALMSIVPPLNLLEYPRLHRSRMVEVIESNQPESWIRAQDVSDLAFIFHADAVEDGTFDCIGMVRAFFVRFQVVGETMQDIMRDEHMPFWSPSGIETYSSRIWHSISEIKNSARTLMCYRKQNQRCQRSAVLSLSLEAWMFISRHCSGQNFSRYLEACPRTEKRFHVDFSLSTVAQVRL